MPGAVHVYAQRVALSIFLPRVRAKMSAAAQLYTWCVSRYRLRAALFIFQLNNSAGYDFYVLKIRYLIEAVRLLCKCVEELIFGLMLPGIVNAFKR